jgi:hypothetical protein
MTKERADKGLEGVHVMTKERIERSDKGQKRKRSESVTPTLDGPSATARIAEEYGKQYMSNLRFLTCACCAFDGPRGTFKELADLHAMGSLLWHRQCKAMIVQALRESTSIGAHYDHIYAEVLNKELTADGLLPGLKYVCKKCFADLKKTRGKDIEDVGAYVRAMFDDDGICNDDSDNDDDSDDEAEEVNEDEDMEELEEEANDDADEGEESAAGQRPTAGHSKPEGGTNAAAGLKNAVLFGLYPGAMPDELKELTYVELSMVAPVNSMTKLQCISVVANHTTKQHNQPTPS